MIAEDGEGAVLTDIDDNTYDDFCLGDTPGMFGHGRPEIARMRDPPRPFVLVDPHPASPSLPAGEAVTLGLTLVGAAVAAGLRALGWS